MEVIDETGVFCPLGGIHLNWVRLLLLVCMSPPGYLAIAEPPVSRRLTPSKFDVYGPNRIYDKHNKVHLVRVPIAIYYFTVNKTKAPKQIIETW